MSKVKALIFTVLFAVVTWGLVIALELVNEDLFNLMAASITGWWLGETTFKFYKWLREGDLNGNKQNT